jgi:PAS domain S-box-containing protein
MKKLKILVVENNTSDFLFLEQLLSDILSFEIDVTHTSNVKSTLSKLGKSLYDLIFLNLTLPDSSGIETFNTIYAAAPMQPIIIFTCLADHQIANKAANNGAQDYLVKGDLTASLLEKTIVYCLARKKAETDTQFQTTILQNVREAIIVTDLKGKILFCNEGAERKFGYTKEELNGKSVSILYYDPIQEFELDEVLNNIKNGHDFIAEWRARRKDKSSLWLEVRTKPMKDQHDNVIGFIGVSRSIETQKRDKEKIKKSEATLKAIFNSSYQAFVLIDRDYKIISYNKVAASLCMEMLNKTLQEESSFFDIIHPFPHEEFLKKFNHTLEGNLSITQTNISIVPNQPLWLETYFTPVEDNEGNILGVSLSVTDITPRKKDEAIIKQQNIELQKTNAELDRFVYSASHDLKAPLSAILGIVQVAQIDPEGSSRDTYIQMIEKNVKRLLHVIKDLTNFSRNARLEIIKEKIDLKEMTEELTGAFAYLKNSSHIKFYYEIDSNNNFISDKLRIQILLNNLLSNAIIFHNIKQESPFIKISTKQHDNKITICVEDNGPGIDKKYHQKIFDMFYRASTTSMGSGLGLYISKGIVEKLNGSIELKSTVGKGTKFIIKLPTNL